MISNHTNSIIGTQHWYNTLLSKMSSIGEYMTDHQLTDKQRAMWGQMLMDCSRELIDHYKAIQDSERTITVKPGHYLTTTQDQ